jgi:hypothetical protein
MGLAEIQAAMARLSIDPALRDRFFADPARVGIELSLGAEESRGLAGVSRRGLEQFAESLRRKRRGQVRRTIPIAARALGDRFGGLFERYVAEAAPRGSRADLDDAIGFIEALSRWGDDERPPWVVDVARYEMARLQAMRAGCRPIIRLFRFPVARLATLRGADGAVSPRPTLAVWWRPTPGGRVRHAVIAWPGSVRRPG